MTAAPTTRRRALTLIETIAAVTIIALAVPPTLALISDATHAQRTSVTAQRAVWLATGVLEHIAADAASSDDDLGFDALGEASYLTAPTTGLHARAASIADFYTAFGITYAVTIGPAVDDNGSATGDPDLDVYRSVRVDVAWPQRGGEASISVARTVSKR